MSGDGDCFIVAANLATDDRGGVELTLCHGQPIGRGEANLGQRYDHAWVEHGDKVIDNSNGLRLLVSRGAYYSLGRIDATAVRRYTPQQARVLMLEHGHYGPWPEPCECQPGDLRTCPWCLGDQLGRYA